MTSFIALMQQKSKPLVCNELLAHQAQRSPMYGLVHDRRSSSALETVLIIIYLNVFAFLMQII